MYDECMTSQKQRTSVTAVLLLLCCGGCYMPAVLLDIIRTIPRLHAAKARTEGWSFLQVLLLGTTPYRIKIINHSMAKFHQARGQPAVVSGVVSPAHIYQQYTTRRLLIVSRTI